MNGGPGGNIDDGSFMFGRPLHIEQLVDWGGFDDFLAFEAERLGLVQSAPASTPVPPGWVFEGWTYVETIPGGGQARLYKVRRADGGDKMFVLKTPNDRAKGLDRFRREPKRLAMLDHPRVVRLVDPRADHDPPFFVTEYCSDGELTAKRLIGLSVRTRLAMFRDICEGVAAAHDEDFVHRDIKPSNILFRAFPDDVVVADFGISFARDEDGDDRLTSLNEPVGSRLFTAPELDGGRADSEDVTPAADVYSLGKLLYFILCGRVFIREEFDMPKNDLAKANPRDQLYRFVNDLLARTVVKDRKGRIQNARLLVEEANRIMDLTDKDAPYLSFDSLPPCQYCKIGEYLVGEKLDVQQAGQQRVGFDRVRNGNGAYFHLTCRNCGHRLDFYPSRDSWEKHWSRKAQ